MLGHGIQGFPRGLADKVREYEALSVGQEVQDGAAYEIADLCQMSGRGAYSPDDIAADWVQVRRDEGNRPFPMVLG